MNELLSFLTELHDRNRSERKRKFRESENNTLLSFSNFFSLLLFPEPNRESGTGLNFVGSDLIAFRGAPIIGVIAAETLKDACVGKIAGNRLLDWKRKVLPQILNRDRASVTFNRS